MFVPIRERACVDLSTWVAFLAFTMPLVILKRTLVNLTIGPLEAALAVEVPLDEVSFIRVAAWICLFSLSTLQALNEVTIVNLAICPPIYADAMHFTILHLSCENVAILHLGRPLTLTLPLLIKLTTPCRLRFAAKYGDLGVGGDLFNACGCEIGLKLADACHEVETALTILMQERIKVLSEALFRR